MGILPDEIKPAMEGVIPSNIVTCSSAGEPNTTVISPGVLCRCRSRGSFIPIF